MGDIKIKKVCGFNVSSIHFSMMILPYIKRELEMERNIITILEGNVDKDIKQILSKITATNEEKEKISKINWNSTDIKRTNIEQNIREKLSENNNLDFVVYGSEKYINYINDIISKLINKTMEEKNIKIIDCYSLDDCNKNMKEILANHDIMFNTSGEHKIKETFEISKKIS